MRLVNPIYFCSQSGTIVFFIYRSQVNDGIKGKKIGILTEGFVDVEEDLARVVRQRALTLKEAGAEVSDVSLPVHIDGGSTMLI